MKRIWVRNISSLLVAVIMWSSLTMGFNNVVRAEGDETTASETEETTEPSETTEETEATEDTEPTEETDAEGDVTTTPTVTPEVTPAEDDEEDDTFEPATQGLGGFVTRMYTVVLSREPEEGGYRDWYHKLETGEMTGREVAEGFLESPEFIDKNLDNEDYINVLYSLFFDREADEGGFEDWNSQLENGASRIEIRDGFYNSTEWANTCLLFGIESGGTGVPNISVTTTPTPTPSSDIEVFVRNLYGECLGREADEWGMNQWIEKLEEHEITGKEAAYGFIFSPEFTENAATMSREDLITIFYTVFLNREPDEDGLNDWVRRTGWSDPVPVLFAGFADSVEFAEKCEAYGIECGDSIEIEGIDNDEIEPEFYEFAQRPDIILGIERLDQVSELYPHTFYNQHNVMNETTTSEVMYVTDREIEVVEHFAETHFGTGWSPAQKVAYTLWWIHMNVRYANTSAAWASISNCGYAEAIFERRAGQCAHYNGALITMMIWLGYDANMILGSRGYNGGIGARHYWSEVTIGEDVYVMECGNYGDYPYWYYFCADYSETTKFIKNGVNMG